MTEMPRKPLGLPPRAPSDEAPANTDRRPVRGGASKRKTAAELAQANAAYAAKARALQEKPRGTPSRAPVVPKLPLMVRKSPAAPATEKGAVQSGVRISKLMAERGLCSRRDADGYIERGWVFVDGLRVTELGTRADPAVKITLAREAQIQQTWQMTILLHKPVGYVSGQPEPGFTPAVTLIQPENQFSTADTPAFHPRHLKGLAPAGRLDIDSTGLLVLTQDGRVARQLIGEDSQVDKEYLVRVEGRLNAAGLALLNHGLSLDGKQLKPAKVEWLNEDQLRFVLREGRKRQIRRMCELVGLHVVGLKRVRIGGIKLGDLPLGQWRFLREDEGF
jgi:23S rRNA pseudouridine2604 synthase